MIKLSTEMHTLTNLSRILIAALAIAMTVACSSSKTARLQTWLPQPAIHSHNDYDQQEPFYGAFRAGAASIEADVFLVDGQVMLGHDSPTRRSVRESYLNPIREAFRKNGGSVYPKGRGLQLLVDLKDGAPSLVALQQRIEAEYKECFDVRHNPGAARLVITGDKIKPNEFRLYADFVFFDSRPGAELTDEQLERVAMVSDYFGSYSKWKGNGTMKAEDQQKLSKVIEQAHAKGKKVRFWAFPDNPNAWRTAVEMGIDFVNTDHPADVAEYFQMQK